MSDGWDPDPDLVGRVKIGNVGGDVIGVDVKGSDNIIGKNTKVVYLSRIADG